MININLFHLVIGIFENITLLNMIGLFAERRNNIAKYSAFLFLVFNSMYFQCTGSMLYLIQLSIIICYVLFGCLQGQFYMKLCNTFLVLTLLLLLDVAFVSIISHYSVDNAVLVQPYNRLNIISSTLARAVFFIIYLMIKSKKLYHQFINTIQWVVFFLSTLVVLMIVITVYFILIYYDLDIEPTIIIALVMVLYLTFLYYIFVISLNQEKLYMNSIETQAIENNKKLLNDLSTTIEENSKLRHDLKLHFATLKMKAEQGSLEEVKEYIDTLSDHIAITDVIQTNNPVLNNLINLAIAKFKEKNITFTYHIIYDLHLIKDVDLSILLGNLLENAIEAQVFVASESFIDLTIELKNDLQAIKLCNRCNTKMLKKKGNRYNTIKRDKAKHGLGLLSIESMVAKYHGSINYHYEEDIFEVSILLPQIEA